MHGSRSTARSSLSLVLHRKSTRAAGRRNRRPGRWGIIAALVSLLLSLTIHTASALPYDTRNADGGWRPDNNDHTFCFGGTIPQDVFWLTLHGFATLDDQTVMWDTYVGTCTSVTDVVVTYINAPSLGWAGYYECNGSNSANECESATIWLNDYQLNVDWDWTATSCHEVGHTVGLSHGWLNDCMMPSAFTTPDWWYQFYSPDQVRQINCRCQ